MSASTLENPWTAAETKPVEKTGANVAQWTLLALLVSSIAINYIDRGALSVSVPVMKTEFALTEYQVGWLLSAFFWTYALIQLPAGWLVDRVDVKWIYAAGYFIWTVATGLTGVVTGFETLIFARLLLGVGESVAYPATSRIIVQNFAEHQRGLANALVDAGSKLGPALSMLVGGYLVHRFGWRPFFIVLGVGGLVWLLPWFLVVPSRKVETAKESPAVGPTSWQLLGRREVWGTAIGMFALGYCWYFLISWLPSYLTKVRGLSMDDMAMAGSLPFWGMAAATVATGYASDRWIACGGSATRVRLSFALSGFMFAAVFLVLASWAETPGWCIGLLVATCASLGMFSANVWAMTQTLAGPMAAGRWSGIQNCIGNMGGVAASIWTGWIVQSTGSYNLAFYIAAMTLVLGTASYLILVRRIEPLDWNCKEVPTSC